MLVTQSVTPVYYNNPAYTTLSINENVQKQESGFLSAEQSNAPSISF